MELHVLSKCLLIITCITGCGPFAFATPVLKSISGGSYLYGFSQFDLDTVASEIQSKNLRSVDQVLSLFPEDFRKNYILIRDSASLQKSQIPSHLGEVAKPRVIMYGGQGLMASFTHESLPGGNAIEFLQFNADSKWETAEFVENKGLERNPKKCALCHGTETRPLWEGYSCWPNAYGSEPGRLLPEHHAELTQFVDSIRPNSRYGLLLDLNKNYLERFKSSDPRYYDPRYMGLRAEPTVKFTSYIHDFDFVRTANLLKTHPEYNQLKFLMVGTIIGCDTEEQKPFLADFSGKKRGPRYTYQRFFTPSAWQTWRVAFEKLKVEMANYAKVKYSEANQRELRCSFNEKPTASKVMLKLLFRVYGAPSHQLFSGFHPLESEYSTDPNGTSANATTDLAMFIAQQDPEFGRILQSKDRDMICANLAAASRTAIENKVSIQNVKIQSDPDFENLKVTATFAKCVACHVVGTEAIGADAPAIPFTNANAFMEWLRTKPGRKDEILRRTDPKNIHSADYMPQVGGRRVFDRTVIVDYLKETEVEH